MIRPPAVAPDYAEDEARLARYRRAVIGVLILVALGSLAIGAPSDLAIPAGERWFLLAGSVVFAAVVYAFGLRSAPTHRPAPWDRRRNRDGAQLASGPDENGRMTVRIMIAEDQTMVWQALVAREGEVLAACTSHDAIADVAARLHLSPGTVRNHRSAAIEKLGARNRGEAVQMAQQKGWL